jgi:two-component system response regulator RegX3
MVPGRREAATVLVVDGDETLAASLRASAPREGLRLQFVDGEDATQAILDHPHLILLDVTSDYSAGIERCHKLRAQTEVPIVIVTAQGRGIDAVLALDAGADDFIEKPARLRELLARLRAVLRRAAQAEDSHVPGEAEALVVGAVTLDPTRYEVHIDGVACHLPLKEFELLRVLLSNAGRTMSRQLLIRRVWGPDYVGDTKTLDVHVKRLRARIEENPSTPRRITTVRGVGYRYDLGAASD